MKKLFFIWCLISYAVKSQTAWNLYLQEFLNRYVPFGQYDINEKVPAPKNELEETCNENQLLLQLARLYAISPERIIILFTSNSINKICQDIGNVLDHINATISNCTPLKSDNLYMKLHNGLDYFNSYICLHNPKIGKNHIIKYHACFTKIRKDLVDCEGPPDWFEKSNETVCEHYLDIINCNCIKAGMLCGLEAASMLRSFSDEIMKRILKFQCKISRSLTHIDDPLPARGCLFKCHIYFILYTYLLF